MDIANLGAALVCLVQLEAEEYVCGLHDNFCRVHILRLRGICLEEVDKHAPPVVLQHLSHQFFALRGVSLYLIQNSLSELASVVSL